MKISIAMSTFNGEKFLKEQLSSFLTQTVLPDELVVCDDGSNDDTINILNAFSSAAPFEVAVHQNSVNLGSSISFGRALGLCSGDTIFLSDQDDVWFPNKIENVTRIFDANKNALVVINDAELTDENLFPTGLSQAGQICDSGLSADDLINGCFSAVSSKLLKLILPITSNQPAHDTYIHQLARSMDGRVYTSEVLQYYRRHGRNLSNNYTSSVSRVSVWDMFLNYASADTRSALKSDLSLLEDIYSRLSGAYQSDDDTLLNRQIETGRRNILLKKETIQDRLKILGKPRYKRAPVALAFWFRGGYRSFSGSKSMIKDLML